MQFIRTDMAEKVGDRMIERMGGYVPMETLIQGMLFLFIRIKKIYIKNK